MSMTLDPLQQEVRHGDLYVGRPRTGVTTKSPRRPFPDIQILLKKGSVLNRHYPAAVAADTKSNGDISDRVHNCTVRAT
jgi:hypothetical protein